MSSKKASGILRPAFGAAGGLAVVRTVRLLVISALIISSGACGPSGAAPLDASVTFIPPSQSASTSSGAEPSETEGLETEQPEATPVNKIGCDLLTLAEVSAVVGTEIQDVEEVTDVPGGFGCLWSTPPGPTTTPVTVSVDVDPENVAAARANIANVAVAPEPGAGAKEAWWGPLNVLWLFTDKEFVTIHVLSAGDTKQAALLLAPLVVKRLDE
jgi:hypothetical protein